MSYLSPDDVGARVTVRRRDPAGALRDVLGVLESADDDELAIRRADGDLVSVKVGDVVAARVVGPSPREALELEAVSARGWPAVEEMWLGRWWLRAAGGFTARANSVRPLGSPGVDVEAALAFVCGWYRSRDLPPKARVVVGASADRELAGRGWAPDLETVVMTATCARVASRLRSLARDGAARRDVELAGEPSQEWLTLFRGGAAPAVARHVLGGERVAFASIRGPVAIGRANAEPPWVGFTAIEVTPKARRRGHARAVIDALLAWAVSVGATRAYLEVLAGNDPAIRLYESLGFAEHHRYVYRQPPRTPNPT